MTYASTSIDRRAIYYARAATLIAADPLDFYTRAEKGRKFQTSRLNAGPARAQAIVERCLGDIGRIGVTSAWATP
jgi:hypothetical protein